MHHILSSQLGSIYNSAYFCWFTFYYHQLADGIYFCDDVLQHSADQFERLLMEMCADEDGDLLIESAVKNPPKVFVVSSLVSMVPAQPFLFRNYQV